MSTTPRSKSAILLCYHFPPSPEVASRRVSSFARALGGTGVNVLVVSAFGNKPITAGERLASNVYAVPVHDAPRRLMRLLVSVKRFFVRDVTSDSTPSPIEQTGSRAGGRYAASSGPTGRLRELFFHSIYALDYHKHWSWLAYRQALRAARGLDVIAVIVSGPPFSTFFAAYLLAKRLRAPLVADFRDPFYAQATFTGPVGRVSRMLARLIERRVAGSAAGILCASPGIAHALQEEYPDASGRIHEIMNGFDSSQVRRAVDTGGRLSILFAGVLYLGRNPFPFLEALERLLAQPRIDSNRITVDLVGRCDIYAGIRIVDWLQHKRAATVVTITASVPEFELRTFIERATVLLNLAQGQPRQIPAKTFEHLASGCEVISICEAESDTARLLDALPGVFRLDPDDSEGLYNALLELYERHVVQGRISAPSETSVAAFSRHAQTELFLQVVKSVTGMNGDRSPSSFTTATPGA